MQTGPRITVEVPVLSVGSRPSDYEELGRYADALRRPQGLHLTLLHIGVLAEFTRDIADWTKGITSAAAATSTTVAWLYGLPALDGFSGRAERLIVLGRGNICGLEVDVAGQVRNYQASLV